MPFGNTQHIIQILDGSMENKCDGSCVEPKITNIQRGDSIKFVHNDCEGCHHMRILTNESEKQADSSLEYFSVDSDHRWWVEETRMFQDIQHPWILGKFVVSSEVQDVQSEPIVCPQGSEPVNGKCPDKPVIESTIESTIEPKLGIASFVDKSKNPQSYIDRYNSEPSYKKWFDDNYPQYDSIEQAVGLELTKKIPDWVKNIFLWYGQDQVSEDELLNAIKYLINEGILVVE